MLYVAFWQTCVSRHCLWSWLVCVSEAISARRCLLEHTWSLSCHVSVAARIVGMCLVAGFGEHVSAFFFLSGFECRGCSSRRGAGG
ncbi:unnamed protein product, partial [Ectocarpus sp. 6 AP-2014]